MAHDRKANKQGGIQSAASPHQPEDGTGSLGGKQKQRYSCMGIQEWQGAKVPRLQDPEKVRFW